MGQLVFQANAGGQTALVGPNPSTAIAINIPATNGNMVTTGDSGTVTKTMLASTVYSAPNAIGSVTPAAGSFTTLTLTSALAFPAGTVSAPSISTTGDSNTGIFFPAADTIAFAEGGVESMRINDAGNLGIGTASPQIKLEVAGSARISSIQNPTSGSGLEIGYDGTQAILQAFTNRATLASAPVAIAGDLRFNSGYGSTAIAFGCRVWVNFNGTGTVAIRASGNVSSITDNGAGDYTVNFTTAMPDANYALSGGASRGSGDTSPNGPFGVGIYQASVPATGSVRIQTGYGGSQASAGSNQDAVYVCVAIHR